MDSKEAVTCLVIGGCFILLPVSWWMGKDGAVTTAVFSLLSLTAGTFLGFKLAEK